MPTIARGKIALVGAGEYLPTMAAVDSMLLQRIEGEPRVVVLPTAAVPDGKVITERWAQMGTDYFSRLGASVEPVMLLTRDDANNAAIVTKLATANFIYFSGGKPNYLLQTLKDTLAWQAIKGIFSTGGVVAGCSAGAMVMGGTIFDFPQVWQKRQALGLVPGIAVIPHFNELPALILDTIARAASKETIVGIDGATALVWSDGEWKAEGSGGVTLFKEKGKVRYTAGESLPLAPLEQSS